jgi:thiamine-phosphate pyrophosphorylase
VSPLLDPRIHRLQAIVDVQTAERAGWKPADLARALLDGGARFLQLRAKGLASGPFLALSDRLVELAHSYGAVVLVNDRADLARLSGADGVHLGQDDLAPAAARRLVGPEAILGYSTHNQAQIESALPEPVSYVAVGPVYGTVTKDTGYAPVGLDLVAHAARRAGELPVVAIGGITLESARDVLAAGASAVAVIGDLLTGGEPSARVAAFIRALYAREGPGDS